MCSRTLYAAALLTTHLYSPHTSTHHFTILLSLLQHPEIESTEEFDKALTAEYEGLDADGKAPYEAKAVEDLERFEKEDALYKESKMPKGAASKGGKKEEKDDAEEEEE